MLNSKRIWLAATAVALATAAHGQTAPQAQKTPAPTRTAPPKTAPSPGAAGKKAAEKTVEEVVVTGESQNGYRASIDRRSYGVANDLAASTGTISDALKNIPSVEVDVQGNVSLRGDTNVTILVDGKPSALFRGQSAAQALQSLPADSVERVEVITNPSSEFSPEGSAGIINLVMKKNRRAGTSGSVRFNTATAGGRNGGASYAYNRNDLTLSADAGFRHDPQHVTVNDDRTQLDGAGHELQRTHQVIDQRGPADQWNARAGADYDLGKTDRLSAEIHAYQNDRGMFNRNRVQGFGPSGALNALIEQDGPNRALRQATGGSASWRRTEDFDNDLSASLSHETTYERGDIAIDAVTSLPAAPPSFQDVRTHNILALSDLRGDLRRALPGDAKLRAGVELRIDDNSYDAVDVRGATAATATLDRTLSNLFLFKQTVGSAYATYERPFGDWTVLGGLRVENVEQDLNQVTAAITRDRTYLRAYPTLHVNYRFADSQQLTLSYSRRIQRPNPSDLNPLRLEYDQFNFRSGNPNLKPERTDSFEAGWQYRAGGTFYVATAYYRVSANDFTDVVVDLGAGALLSTKQNLASSKHAGVELVANGHLTKDLSYNVSTNIYYAEIDPGSSPLSSALGPVAAQSAIEGGGRFSLNWNATASDILQASGQMNARRLTPQGHSDPSYVAFLGYRHKVSDKLAVVFNIQDVFHTAGGHSVIDTPILRERTSFSGRSRAAYMGFAWTFGSPPKARPAPPPPEPESETIHG